MITVLNPFGRALAAGLDINSLLASDPEAGSRELDRLCGETAAELKTTDRIRYRLVGASPEHCTPMQYGGFYLECDRELLSAHEGPVDLVVEGAEPYMDFVSDLPAASIQQGEPVHA